MDRNDLIRAQERLPEITQVWSDRVERLEAERREARASWQRLDRSRKGARDGVARIYHIIDRCDRSIAFLDRALLHLDDLEHGTREVEKVHPVPLQGTTVPRR
jgi:hypothetical protein